MKARNSANRRPGQPVDDAGCLPAQPEPRVWNGRAYTPVGPGTQRIYDDIHNLAIASAARGRHIGRMTAETRPILIAGPTASGKSELALGLAERFGGCVINADALQVYEGWRILTARPSEADEARAPHHLYGHVPLTTADYSVGRWLRELEPLLARCAAEGRRPIIVGGTGLYFKALTEGLAEIPETPPEIRAAMEERLAEIGPEAFFEELRARDPDTAGQIDAANPRRVLRAREVLETTGTGLAAWRARTPPPLLPLGAVDALVLEPPRDLLRERIARRFDQMLADGGLDEVAAVSARGFAAEDFARLPGLKALGASELRAHLLGESSRDEAVERAVAATRQYAKRQSTWARNQMNAWKRLSAHDYSKINADFVSNFLVIG